MRSSAPVVTKARAISVRLAAAAALLLLVLPGCPKQKADTTPPAPTSTIPDARPAVPVADPYTPPRVWFDTDVPPMRELRFLQRDALDIVSLRVVVPYGSASDPPGKAGLAELTAEMMEQGAGEMDSFALALAAERIGADMAVWAGRDFSVAQVDVLGSEMDAALRLLADVLLRPRFEPSEWERTHALWLEDLEARAFDAPSVAAVVGDAVLYGRDHPYGHPGAGWLDTVRTLSLDDVRAFHRGHWRLDTATVVAVGRFDRAALKPALAAAFAGTKSPAEPPPPLAMPSAPESGWPALVVVDRPDSPQTVLRVGRPGLPTGIERTALEIDRFVLGGSFTSRLMANLREDKGYTYGIYARLASLRGPGPFFASGSVQSEVTGKALKEIVSELDRMATAGPVEEEVEKARASLRNADVETYEQVAGTADRIAALSGLGLPARFDADAAAARELLDLDALVREAGFFAPQPMLVVAVGQQASITEQLAAEGIDLGTPLLLDPEGLPRL